MAELLANAHRTLVSDSLPKEHFSFQSLELSPQYGVLALFLLILVIGLGAVYYMIKIVENKPWEGDIMNYPI